MDAQSSFPQITAIVIDDEPDMATVFSEYLELLDIKVLATGHSGKDAFDLYKTWAPNFVFTDLMMPDYDGYYGVAKIKEFNPDSKIIVITADVSQSATEKLSELGADGVIYKPCDINKLVQTISRLYQGRLAKIES